MQWAEGSVSVGRLWRLVLRRLGVARVIGLGILALALAVKVLDPGLIESLQLRTFDLMQKLKPRERGALPVAIIDIDEKSLAELGQWPWPRTVMGEVIDRAMADGVAAIALDIVFAEPDRMSPALYAAGARGLSAASREELSKLPGNDEALAAVLKRSRVVLGQSGLPMAAASTAPPGRQTPVATIGGDPRPFLVGYAGLLANVPVLEAAASGSGLFSIRNEFDGIVRRVGLVSTVDGRLAPGLAVELLRVATGGDAFAVKSNAAGVASVVVGGVEVPTDRNGRIWVNYGRHDKARYVSAADVASGRMPRGRLAGHLALVGTSAVGLGDIRATPLTGAMPGVEIHAQLLETILSKSWLERPHYAIGAEIVAAVLLSVIVIAAMPALGAVRALALGAALAGVVAGGAWLLFSQYRLLLDPLYPLATSFAVFLAMTFVNYRQEELKRRTIRTAFSRYLNPAMVDELALHPERLSLGGETRELTILFSDVRGFTSISEGYRDDPQGLTRLINRLLTPVSRAIVETRGTIDKYMGDAVMAFWNAPLDDADHAANACRAALEMVRRLDALNAEREAEDAAEGRAHLPMRIGIGVNSGVCVVGNMGSDIRFDYSVLGDSVNVASRLEGQTKEYGVPILVGDATARHVLERLALIEVDLIRVKGKSVPERIYALLGAEDVAQSAEFGAAREEIGRLLAAYRAADWAAARAVLTHATAARAAGLGGLIETYAERLDAFAADPPGPDWDGAYVAKSK